MHVYSAGFRRGARSTVKRGVYSAGFRRGTSLRSSPPQRSEESAVYVLSMEFRFTAELHGGAYLRSETRIYSVDFHS